jgi:hypothetical protein
MLFGSRPNLLYNVLGELFNVQISYFSNSKSEIAETINGMIFFVFLSNRPRIFHEYTNGGTYIRVFVTYSWMVGLNPPGFAIAVGVLIWNCCFLTTSIDDDGWFGLYCLLPIGV